MNANSSNYDTLVSQCDKEPIHMLGRVQSHGVLLAAGSDGELLFVSANAFHVFQIEQEDISGKTVWQLLGKELSHAARGAYHQALITGKPHRIVNVTLPFMASAHDISIHDSSDVIILEFEPHIENDGMDNFLLAMMNQFNQSDDVETLYEQLVEGVRLFTHYDRVMLYRFDHDGSGEVVAESKEKELPPFLGLKYPASDIPKQARALYKKNLIRVISDVHAPDHKLVVLDSKRDKLDLSFSRIRSVSEVHIQYLKNMGVGASMSISIIVEGELWGLIACHHNSARMLSGKMLEQLELFAEFFSLELNKRLVVERIAISEKANMAYTKVIGNVSPSVSIPQMVIERYDFFKSLIDIDGIGCSFNGEYRHRGKSLGSKKINHLLNFLKGNTDKQIYATDKLESLDPSLRDNNVSGVLAIQVSSHPVDYILLFRKAVVQEVRWAGNPDKSVVSNGDVKLTPRSSFEQWIVSHDDQSLAWSVLDVERAKAIRTGIMDLTIQHLHEKESIQKEAKERLQLLIGELNHRVRNILNLVNAIVSQTSHDKTDIGLFVESLSARISALALGHDQLTHSSWKSISFRTLLWNELRAYMINESVFRIEGPDINISAYGVTPVVLVFHELITNAAKYGALSASSSDGTVSVTWWLDDQGNLTIEWVEKGGPPITELGPDGFGMTIIRSVIPHELGGETDIMALTTGVKAVFKIPHKHVEYDEAKANLSNDTDTSDNDKNADNAAQEKDRYFEKACIVEDNLLISMDLQKKLKSVGIPNASIFGSVSAARVGIQKERPDIIFLDMHLGSENTIQLATELLEHSTPFLFITGYGAELEIPESLSSIHVLSKPVNIKTLENVLAELK
jgi:light-regulated signal transduction histidine kinase (bacteriophytochrome)/CheY-like chemotaxis protein